MNTNKLNNYEKDSAKIENILKTADFSSETKIKQSLKDKLIQKINQQEQKPAGNLTFVWKLFKPVVYAPVFAVIVLFVFVLTVKKDLEVNQHFYINKITFKYLGKNYIKTEKLNDGIRYYDSQTKQFYIKAI